MSYNKVNAAVVGCGMISNIYIKNLKQMFQIIDLTTLCDLNRANAEEKAQQYGIERVMSIDEVAEAEDIELVINLTGPAAHYSVIKQMLEHGKHVWTEKTLTTDLEEARELVKLAEEKGLYLGVAPDTVLGAGVQTAKKVFDAGMIGKVTSGIVSVNRNQILNSELFYFLRGEGGALPHDVGIYYIATLLTLLGPVKAIRAFGAPAMEHEPELLYCNSEVQPWQIPGNNILSASLLFECGAVVSVHFDGNTVNSEQHNITLFGTEGILKLGDPNSFNGTVRLIRPESGECEIPFTHEYDGKNTVSDPTPFDHYGHRGVGVAEMAYAIRGNRSNRCSKEYGLHCMEVLHGMDLAAADGSTFEPRSRFEMKGLSSGYYSSIYGGMIRGDAERSLIE